MAQLQLNGNVHAFDYQKDGAIDRLVGWRPQQGWPALFRYDPQIGALAAAALERAGAREITEFQTEYVPAKDPKEENAVRRRDRANYRLTTDRDYFYSYPSEGAIVLTRKDNGRKISGDYQIRRGVLATEGESSKRQTVYYRAPGKSYDGKLRRIEEDGRVVTEYRYDRKTGAIKEVTDENGLITFFDYAPGPVSRFGPKPARIRRGTRKANAVIAQYEYDAAGRLLASKDAEGRVTRVTYSPRGELATVADPAGGKTSFTYDAFGRITAVNRDGAVERTAFDAQGRVATRTAADGSKTTLLYDEAGRVVGAQRDGKTLVTYRRDALGRISEEIDPLGRSKKYDYDAKGNLLAECAANGATTRYEYDAQDRRTVQIDGNGNRIHFEYDPAGRLIKQTNALGKILAWTYGPTGQLIARDNGVRTTTYLHDARKRVTHVDYASTPDAIAPASSFGETAVAAAAKSPPATAASTPDRPQTVDYTYDQEGRVLTAVTPDAQFKYLRDAQGRVQATRCVAGGREQLLRYRYDAVGRRTGLILAELRAAVAPSGGHPGRDAGYDVLQQTEYTYDPAGRLTGILDNGDLAVSYRYDAAGRLAAKTFGNGMQAAISYDAAGRLAKMIFSGGPLPEPKTLAYSWDAASQVTRREWNGETQRYGYDASGQLLEVADAATGAVLEAYAYDKAGNMLEKTIDGEKTTMA